MKRRKKRKRQPRDSDAKKGAKWSKYFHSEDFVRWMKSLPCVKCGSRKMVEVHHEPTIGSGRGSWKDTSPLCRSCHTTGPGARHGLNSGVVTFWESVGKPYAQSNAETHAKWLDVVG